MKIGAILRRTPARDRARQLAATRTPHRTNQLHSKDVLKFAAGGTSPKIQGAPRPRPLRIASCTAGRTCAIFSLSRVGYTRLVSSTTNKSRDGSIQIEVPVNPRWPNVPGEK